MPAQSKEIMSHILG